MLRPITVVVNNTVMLYNCNFTKDGKTLSKMHNLNTSTQFTLKQLYSKVCFEINKFTREGN